MTDILIQGMEIWECCADCPMSGWAEVDRCLVSGRDISSYAAGGKPPDCKIHELQEHGDLIELDAKVDCQYYDEEHEEWTVETVTVEQVLHGCLEKMPPVIVPANKEGRA